MRLHVVTGLGRGLSVEVAGERFVVGRDPSCDLVLNDASVARRHAAFEAVSATTYLLRDLGSATGTFVDGRRIDGPVALRGAEELRFGRTTVRLSLAAYPPGRPWWRAGWVLPAAALVLLVAAGAAVGAVLATRGGDEPPPSFFDAVAPPPSTTAEAPATAEASEPVEEPAPVAEPVDAPPGPGVIAFARGDGAGTRILLANPDGTGQALVADATGREPAVSPDGTRVAFVTPEGAVVVVPLTGGEPEMLARVPGRALDPDWSPDGSRLAVASETGGVAVVDLSGREARLGAGDAHSPSWSPDGRRLALAAGVSADTMVVGTVAEGGEDARPLATVEPLASRDRAGVDWSPDGQRIAFTCARADADGQARTGVCVMNAEGGEVSAIGGSAGADFDPSWSPDGRRIAFTSDRDGNEEIYVMDADGGGQRRLTIDPAPDRDPAWGPGGRLSVRGAGATVYVDGFADPGDGWETFANDQDASAGYEDERLVLRMARPEYVVTSDSGRRWAGPLAVAVTARSGSGSREIAFGVVCDYVDQRTFTLLGITPDGRAAIARWVDGRERILSGGGEWSPPAAVDGSAGHYRIEARCEGRSLTLAVNGREVATATGPRAEGTVGLFLRTFAEGDGAVTFDDVVVMRSALAGSAR